MDDHNYTLGEIKMAKYRIEIDRDTCIGCGVAPAICPEIYMLDPNDGKNRITDKYLIKLDEHKAIGEIPEELYECAKAGADSCPVSAIRIIKIE